MSEASDLLDLFESCEVGLTISDDDACLEDLDFRVFIPKELELFCVGACEALADLRDESEGEDFEELDWTLKMISFLDIVPELDEQRYRKFNATDLNRSETIRELREFTGTCKKPLHEQLRAFVGQTDDPIFDLVGQAIYVEPDIDLKLEFDEYREFRESLLDEMAICRDELDRMSIDVLKDRLEARLKDSSVIGEQRNRAEKKLAAIDNGEWIDEFDEFEEVKDKHVAEVLSSSFALLRCHPASVAK